jgi:hypothetical protein
MGEYLGSFTPLTPIIGYHFLFHSSHSPFTPNHVTIFSSDSNIEMTEDEALYMLH